MSGVFYLIVGTIVGGFVGAYLSTRYALRASRARLVIAGSGNGGSAGGKQRWQVRIGNQPSFLGQNTDGETAKDLHAWIRLEEQKGQVYPVFWEGETPEGNATIEPGGSRGINFFYWSPGDAGYAVFDQQNEPILRFKERRTKFVLQLNDRFGRTTRFPFIVYYDDSHLKQPPRLDVRFPPTLRQRWSTLLGGLQRARRAFARFR